jgi:hypothetical protein
MFPNELEGTSAFKRDFPSDILRAVRLQIDIYGVLQLCQRPLNADLRKKNHNNDFIAPIFRNHLMPYRCALSFA